jgi:2-oxoglutarate ferredoxin oxidoreductase subunit alpha
MFALGLLTWIYGRDLERTRSQVAGQFKKKSGVQETNLALLERGRLWAEANLDLRIDVPPRPSDRAMVVMNGNQALALGAVASAWSSAPCTRSRRRRPSRTS